MGYEEVPTVIPCLIFKKEAKYSEKLVLEERQLTVQGESLDKCKKVFDEEWKKK